MVTPQIVPRIGYKPVWGTIFGAKSHNLDGMPAKHGRVFGMGVDTTLVCQEVLVYKEHARDWTICKDFCRHLLGTRSIATALLADTVACGPKAL